MSQVKFMLKHSYKDFGGVMNVLTLMRMRMLPMDIEDIMFGYMVAKDWIEWITNSKASDRPSIAGTEAATDMLGIFQDGAKACEELLEELSYEVYLLIDNLNPNLHTLYQGRGSVEAEDVRMYHRSLRFAAKFLDEDRGDSHYSKKLDEKNVPSLESIRPWMPHTKTLPKLKNLGFNLGTTLT